MAKVETVREGMRRGDYYEVVLRQTFSAPYTGSPSELFRRIQKASPSPYEFFLQFGDEQLVGASPEMFVRVEGRRVQTCPISGTARRTGDPLKRRGQHPRIAQLVEGRIRADHVHRRGSQRQVAGVRSRLGSRHRPALDRILRGRISHRGPRGRSHLPKASIPSTHFSRTCGPSP